METTLTDDAAVAKDIWDTVCFACHKLGNDGGTVGPNLTNIGSRRDYDTLRGIIADPLSAYDESVMPPFEDKLTQGADRRAGEIPGVNEVTKNETDACLFRLSFQPFVRHSVCMQLQCNSTCGAFLQYSLQYFVPVGTMQ